MPLPREIAARDLMSADHSRQIKIIADGDSRTFFAFSRSGVKQAMNKLQSYWYYVNAQIGGRVILPPENDVGVAGQNTADILARVDATMALLGDVIILWMSINDLAVPLTLSQTIANFQAYIAKAKAAGKRLIIVNELPKDASPSAATLAFVGGVRHFLRSLPRTNYLAVVDPLPLVITDALATTPALQVALFPDYLHPSAAGSLKIAALIADVLKSWFPALQRLPNTNGFTYAQVGAGGNHVANAMMGGTGGSKGSMVTGSVADSWTLSRLGAGAADSAWTVVGSKTVAADGLGAWQTVDISGTAPSTQLLVQLLQNLTVTDFAAGDILEMVGELVINSASVSARDVQMCLLVTDADGSNQIVGAGGSNSGQQLPSGSIPFISTPQIQLASSITKVTAFWQATVDVGSSPALNFSCRNVAVRKVT